MIRTPKTNYVMIETDINQVINYFAWEVSQQLSQNALSSGERLEMRRNDGQHI